MKMDQKTPAAFPRATYEPDASGEVECCIEKAVMDLLSLCVFSGIVITYAAPGFPLYYIDERMLALLDYSSQAELIAANGQAMINCIRPEDRDCAGPSKWDLLYNDISDDVQGQGAYLGQGNGRTETVVQRSIRVGQSLSGYYRANRGTGRAGIYCAVSNWGDIPGQNGS